MTRGMVLAAGWGRRLRPLTDVLPKPLVPFFGRPTLAHALEHMARCGITQTAVNTFHLAEDLEAGLAGESGLPEVQISREEELLGTGGGVRRLASFLGAEPEFVLMNGDIIASVPWVDVLEHHRVNEADVTLVTVTRPNLPAALHKVAIDETGRVAEVDGVFCPGVKGPQRAIYAGALVGGGALLAALPDGREACLKVEGFWPLLRRGARVFAFPMEGLWADIGTPAQYVGAHEAVLGADFGVRARWMPPGVVERSPGVFIHPSAEVSAGALLEGPMLVGADVQIGAGARLGEHVVLGRGSRVAAGARLDRVVTWAQSEVEGAHRGAVFWPGGEFVI